VGIFVGAREGLEVGPCVDAMGEGVVDEGSLVHSSAQASRREAA